MQSIINFLFCAILLVSTSTVSAKCSSNLGTCYRTIPGRDFSGWYQECSDKIAKRSGYIGTWYETVGNYANGGAGCQCRYTASTPGVWELARRSLWDRAITNKHDCSDALYSNICDPGEGSVTYTFGCR